MFGASSGCGTIAFRAGDETTASRLFTKSTSNAWLGKGDRSSTQLVLLKWMWATSKCCAQARDHAKVALVVHPVQRVVLCPVEFDGHLIGLPEHVVGRSQQ